MMPLFPNLRARVRTHERMDAPDVDSVQLQRSLRYLRRINALLGYTRATLEHLETFSRNWRPAELITIVDVATGSADVPGAILKWAEPRGFNVRIIGVDRHPRTAHIAAAGNAHRQLRIVRADALALPFGQNSVDYAITSMFLHHLDDADAAAVMNAMGRIARRGVIIADLLRHRRAYFWIRLFSAAANPLVRHDGPASVAQAFTRDEVLRLRDRAGLDYACYHHHFGHRFVLAGEKDFGH